MLNFQVVVSYDLLLFISNCCTPKSKGKCSRCQMVCVDQETGVRSVQPMKTLGKMRGSKVCFKEKIFDADCFMYS